MRLTDLVSGMDISLFPIIGLIVFGLVFLAVTIRTLRSPRDRAERAAFLPLEDGEDTATTAGQEVRHG